MRASPLAPARLANRHAPFRPSTPLLHPALPRPLSLVQRSFTSTPSPRAVPAATARRLAFPEEPLHLGVQHRFGYFAGRIGQSLDGGRYTIRRKLGYGKFSNVWLATDADEGDAPVAIKVCTAFKTRRHIVGKSRELAAWQRLLSTHSSPSPSPSSPTPLPADKTLTTFLRDFPHRDRHGDHLCLVFRPDAQTVADYVRLKNYAGLQEGFVKKIAGSVLVALGDLKNAGILHTDIKPDNIFFAGSPDPLLEATQAPGPIHDPGEVTLNGATYALPLSAPVALPYASGDAPDALEGHNIILGDLSHAELVGQPATTANFQPDALRAPEVVLNAPLSSAMDVWNLACILFELLTGKRLFWPKEEYGKWSQHDDLLSQMKARTGGEFSKADFQDSKMWNHYFNANGALRRPSTRALPTIREMLAKHTKLVKTQRDLFEDFLGKCLLYNPERRPAALDLLHHPWLKASV